MGPYIRNMTTCFPTTLTTPPRTETVNGHAFRMISLPAGRFEMGSDEGEEESFEQERPRHWVDVPAFELAEFSVTQGLWEAVFDLLSAEQIAMLVPKEIISRLPDNPSGYRGTTRPVEGVMWHEATGFCTALMKITGRIYRLPTESEWEYAARCGQRGILYAGSNQLDEVGWYNGNNATNIMPVGLLYPNDWGLYDMSGNVFEWCADHGHVDYNGAPSDGSAWLSNNEHSHRMRRGGNWFRASTICRSAYREWEFPGSRYGQGFRLAVSLSAK